MFLRPLLRVNRGAGRLWPARQWAMAAVLLTFALLVGVYTTTIPPWEAPDEVAHFAYVSHLLQTGRLPEQREGQLAEAHQPPLYYLIAAAPVLPLRRTLTTHSSQGSGALRVNPQFMWANPGGQEVNAALHTADERFPYTGEALALQLARSTSALAGLLTIALIVKLGWDLFPTRPEVGLLAGVLAAFTPQFLFLSAVLNNDNLLALAATGTWWQLLRALRRPDGWRPWIAVGAWASVAVLAKTSGLLVPAAGGVAVLTVAVQRRTPRLLVRAALVVSVLLLAATGWWFLRNWMLYGDPFGWTAYQRVYTTDLRSAPLQWHDLRVFLTVQFRSFWAQFGWMNVSAPEWYYGVAGLLSSLALGAGVYVALRRRWTISPAHCVAATCLLVAVVLQEGALLALAVRCDASCYQGRYLFPVIGPLMLLASVGLTSLPPRRVVRLAAGGLALVLAGTAAAMPLVAIGPAYTRATVSESDLQRVGHKTGDDFDERLRFEGYEVAARSPSVPRAAHVAEAAPAPAAIDGTPAGEIVVTLYWRALRRLDLDYAVFVHLVDQEQQLVSQKDHPPGWSRGYPPTSWRPGDVVADPHVVPIPAGLAPGTYRLLVGVYDAATGMRLPLTRIRSAGQPAEAPVFLDHVFHWPDGSMQVGASTADPARDSAPK